MDAQTGFLGGMTERVQNGFQTPSLRYGIYALVVGILIAVIVMVVDNMYPFLPSNPVGGPSAEARQFKTFWRNVSEASENMIVPANESPTTLAGQYSVSFQMILADSRTPSLGKFRHVLHRGSNPCGLSASTAGTTGHSAMDPSEISTTEPTYTNLGLPQIMNPGVFLDSYKNDLHILIHTHGREHGANVLWLESLTVTDLPLRVPMTIGIICSGKSLDVYVNCRLYSSLLLKGIPYLPKAENQWFGRYCAFPFTGLIKDLRLWPSAIGVKDYLLLCSGAKFDTAALPTAPASCSTT